MNNFDTIFDKFINSNLSKLKFKDNNFELFLEKGGEKAEIEIKNSKTPLKENHEKTFEEIQKYYPEFQDSIQSCFFKPCMHLSEPNCAVKAKLEAGKISLARMNRYRELVAEATENRRNKYV